MKYNELMEEINNRRFSTLYLFYGEETYLKDEAVRKITESILGARDFNYDLLYGASTNADEIIGIAQTLPVFSPWRLLIVKDADLIPDKETERLLPYIDNPSPLTCIIFVGEKADMRKRFFSSLKERASVVQFYPLFESQLTGWIRLRARELGFKISEGAIELLKENVGGILSSLDNELKKLILYSAGKEAIDEDDVLKVVGQSRMPTIFNLTEAVGEKKTEVVLGILRKILEEGEEPLRVLSMITRQMRLLLKALELKEAGFSQNEIRNKTGISPRFFNAFMGQLKKHSIDTLIRAFKRLQKADLELKTSGKGRDKILEALILDLCGSGSALGR